MINLTQHPATPDQILAGVVNLPAAIQQQLTTLLTFNEIPSIVTLFGRAKQISRLAVESGEKTAMVGGAGYLMPHLERSLAMEGIRPFHAFSVRISEESVDSSGTVIKTNVFKHVGFVG